MGTVGNFTTIAAILLSLWLPVADTAQAETLINAGHMKRARTILEALNRSNPRDARVLYLLSEVHEAFGDPDTALQLAEQALTLDSGSADYHYQVGAMSGEVARKASVFRQLPLAHAVEKEAKIAISLNPKHIDARSLLVTFYLEAPAIVGGDKQKAHEMAAEITRLDPVEGASARAEIARSEKDEAGLEAAYLSGAAAGPQNYDAQLDLAKYYASDTQKKFELAESRAKIALKIDPGQAGAYGLLADLFAQSGRIAELDALLLQSEKNVSDDLSPFYQAAHRFQLQGKELPRAESYFRKYFESALRKRGAPDPAEAHWQLGLVLEKTWPQILSEAIAEVEKAVHMSTNLEDAKKDLKRMKP